MIRAIYGSKYPISHAFRVFIAIGIPKITCCARAHANREIFRQFPSLSKLLKISYTMCDPDARRHVPNKLLPAISNISLHDVSP